MKDRKHSNRQGSQRSRNNRMCVCVCIGREGGREKDYTKLVLVITETEKSENLQSESWKCGRHGNINSSLSKKAWVSEKPMMLSSSATAGEDQCPRAISQAGEVSSYSALQLIGWDLSTLGGTVCFPQSTHSIANRIQRHPHKIIFHQISPWPNWVDT